MISQLMVDDHESLDALLEGLEAELEKQEVVGSLELLDLFWARLAVHIRAENVCLFPAILNARRATFSISLPPIEEVEITIQQLHDDHNFFMDLLSKAMKALRELVTKSEPCIGFATEFSRIQAQVTEVSIRLKAHNNLEEKEVYGWPALMMSFSEVVALKDSLQCEIDNLPPRFS